LVFSYDAVAYEGQPITHAHVDRLAVLGILHGMSPAPIGRCRVLELGCGDGGHLLPHAATLPASEFVGVDLSAAAIARGNERASRLGLRNLTLEQRDIMDVGHGQFDYVVAHGVYSWVPAPVRDKILAIAEASLAPHGIAYVDYNALPGSHLRLMIREMLEFQTASITDPEQKLRHAFALLNLLATSSEPVLVEEVRHARERPPWQLFHDELSESFHPVYFSEFARHARDHRLQFLADSQFPTQQLLSLSEDAQEAIGAVAGGDVVLEQQYLDFMELRRFRHTLLCRDGISLTRPPDAAAIQCLHISTAAERVAPDEFRGPRGARMKTDLAYALAVLDCLSRRRPATMRFDDLSRETSLDADALAHFLLRTYAAGLVDLHTVASPFTLDPGERPRAFSLARLEAAEGDQTVTTLRHSCVELRDEAARRALTLLDGAHDRAELARELGGDVDAKLKALARLALLEG
jgi:SAM-dependent methyltransferase